MSSLCIVPDLRRININMLLKKKKVFCFLNLFSVTKMLWRHFVCRRRKKLVDLSFLRTLSGHMAVGGQTLPITQLVTSHLQDSVSPSFQQATLWSSSVHKHPETHTYTHKPGWPLACRAVQGRKGIIHCKLNKDWLPLGVP